MNLAVKLYPQTIWNDLYQGDFELIANEIAAAGIKTVITPVMQGSRVFFPIDDHKDDWDLTEFQIACNKAGLAFIPEFPVLNDPDTYRRIPQYRPISKDKKYKSEDWYHPICPSNDPYRQYRVDLIVQGITAFEPSIYSLEFIHYPYLAGKSEYESDPTALPPFCYCDFCLAKFQEFSGVADPNSDPVNWFQFRQEMVTYIPVLLAEESERRGLKNQQLIQIPAVPTPGSTANLERLPGINLTQWNNLVQIISPHLYIHQLGTSNEWAHTYLDEIDNFGTFHTIPEIDVPLDLDDPEKSLQLAALLSELRDRHIEILSLFHWELMAGNVALVEFLEEFIED